MADYGLSADGFKRKRLPEIIQSLNDRVADKLGTEIQTGANSLFGQLHGVYGYEIATLWELLEDAYNAMYPPTAQGVQLSNSAALAGIFQIAAERTALTCTCYGQDGATIPYGAQISSNDLTNAVYSCVDPAYTISATRACDVQIIVQTPTAGATYTINIDGVSESYTATTADASAILSGLAGLFTFTDRTLTVSNNILSVTMDDQSLIFSISTSNNLEISKLGSPFNFLCDTAGAIEPAIGAVSNIITQYTGWDSVSNNVDAVTGRDSETDNALRQRWSRSVYGRAFAMVDAIAANIYKTTGVEVFPRVYENTSDEEDEYGRPPHSIEAVVTGGRPQEICEAIFERKAAGIDTYGSISRIVYDSQGIPHTIYYNEPSEVKVWLQIQIDTEGAESGEDFGGLQNLKNAIMDAASAFEVGDDVILQKFYCPIYKNVTGIGYIVISATTGDTPGTYTTTNIEIDPRQIATFAEDRIEVVET